ncbi:unnamed protein product [Eruca vesicaria subsp. sativa]|uniref:Uncharacterized protein n=1 Tax=Eruca vesicaria subsp. sativa TaxID=29727 RepID=A0ABC8JQ05_ERUVS|nr:unnamed protein product [Eruca vesicaria subsp. sativa]
MASVCVNNNVTVSQDFSSYGCFNPRASPSPSFSREDSRSSGSTAPEKKVATEDGDFEFRLEDPVGMLPADELFSEGKLVTKPKTTEKCTMEISGGDDGGGLFSPKAPRCSSRWRELLGLKRFSHQNSKTAATTTFHSNPSRSSTSSLKQFLNRSSKTTSCTSDASLPLLKDCSDSESLSISSSRMSLSSSSSGHDHDDIPRLSLDADRPNHNQLLNQHITGNPFAPSRSQNPNNPPRMRLVPSGRERLGRSPIRPDTAMSRGVSVDSPRLNSSGKIVFQSLERSSSSPSSFNGGTSGYRHRGMERSYSANVRVTPVLNVPVCSIRGGSVIFGQFFSSSNSSSASLQHNRTGSFSSNRASSNYINRGRNSTDRI